MERQQTGRRDSHRRPAIMPINRKLPFISSQMLRHRIHKGGRNIESLYRGIYIGVILL